MTYCVYFPQGARISKETGPGWHFWRREGTLGEEGIGQDRKLGEPASCPTPKPCESLGGIPKSRSFQQEGGGPTGGTKPGLNTHPEFCFWPVLQPPSRLGLFLLKRRTHLLTCPTHPPPRIASSQCVALELGLSHQVYCKS